MANYTNLVLEAVGGVGQAWRCCSLGLLYGGQQVEEELLSILLDTRVVMSLGAL